MKYIAVYNERTERGVLRLVKSTPYIANTSANVSKPSYLCRKTGTRYVFTDEELHTLKQKLNRTH
jgi:hypothetical protein